MTQTSLSHTPIALILPILINLLYQFGMYSNGCGVSDWTYTGVKHYEKVNSSNHRTIK